MARYAQYDPSWSAPQRVTGWYDTNEFDYANFPDPSNLIEVTAEQWELHFNNPNGWIVNNGLLMDADHE